MEYKELDFQEHGIPAENDRVLIVVLDDQGKAVGAKNYNLSELKDFISADALAYLEECRNINLSVNNLATTVNLKTQIVENISVEVESAKNAASSAATNAANYESSALSSRNEAETLVKSAKDEMIASIEQTVESNENGGVNEFTITQKNGVKHLFKVKNGEKGEAGISGSVFGFYIDRINGHLYCNYVDNEAPNFSIRNGHLIYEY